MNRICFLSLATGLMFLSIGCSGVPYKATCQAGANDCFDGYDCAVEPSTGLYVCFKKCTATADCFADQTCDSVIQSQGVCREACTTDNDCTTGLTCKIPAGETLGVCD